MSDSILNKNKGVIVHTLRVIMSEKNITQAKLSTSIGCEESSMCRYLNGELVIPPNVFNRICDKLEITPNHVFQQIPSCLISLDEASYKDRKYNDTVRILRERECISQSCFSDKLGVAHSDISKIESYRTSLTKKKLLMICQVFGEDKWDRSFKLVNMYQNRDTSKERLEIINKPVTEVNKQSSVSTISSIIEEVKGSICDNYCKYSARYKDYDEMLEEVCSSCPLNRL